jgi:hypothetical protein
MNQFDTLYFAKYVGEWDELLFVCHRHPILVIDEVILWTFFGGLVQIADLIGVMYFQIFLITVYLGLLYQIFNWYNDVWVLTRRWIVDIEWNVFSGSTHYIEYSDIQWIQVDTNSFIDTTFWKGDIRINLHGATEEFFLSDAQDPQIVSEYIQWILDESHNAHDDHHMHAEEPVDDRKPFELLLDTLTDMVREHLEKKWHESKEDLEEQKKVIKETLKHVGTLDLRDGVLKISPSNHQNDEEHWGHHGHF